MPASSELPLAPVSAHEASLRAYAALEWLRLDTTHPASHDGDTFSPEDDAAIRARLAQYAADYWD